MPEPDPPDAEGPPAPPTPPTRPIYDLEPGPPQPPPRPAPVVADGAFCIHCGYELSGLSPDAVCPECGTPIERSLRGNMLVDASPDYVRTLRVGLSLILNGILVWVVWMFFGMAGGVWLTSWIGTATGPTAAPGSPAGGVIAFPVVSPTAAELVSEGVALVIGLAVLWGWWLLSTPDPGFVGRDDGARSRVVVRWAVVARSATQLGSFCAGLVAHAVAASPGSTSALALVAIGLGLLELAAFAVWFFASMLYVRWLAPRASNERVYRRAGLLMWLGPVLVTVGSCVCIGPLIALVLYWNMLHWLRQDIKGIEAMGRA